MFLLNACRNLKLFNIFSARAGVLVAAGAFLLAHSGAANAQVRFEGIGLTGDFAVCTDATSIFVPEDNDCAAPIIGPAEEFFPINALTIGPAGSQARFDTGTGAASFSGPTSFTGSIDAGGNRIQNVGAPINAGDAANKGYVDGQNAIQDTRITGVETVNTQQDARLVGVENVNTEQNTRLTGVEIVNTQQDSRLFTLEGAVASQGEEINQINNRIGQLRDRDRELAGGIAIAMALDQPNLLAGQEFAFRVGWGNFDGSNALGVSAAGLVSKDVFGAGSTMVLDVGVGASSVDDMVGGKAGITFGW